MSSLIGGRRRLTDTALAALVPVAACSVALAGLSAWAVTGNAGTPARMRVTEGRVLLPSDGVAETAAFFRLTNDGGSTDRLLRVTSSIAPGGITLTGHRMNGANSAYRSTVDSVAVAGRDSVVMSPTGVDLTLVTGGRKLRSGDLVSFTLEFQRSRPVKVLAVVVRPGTFSLQ
ncbi:copper chaperone PCu(A)C [Streptomyces fagopyri]|uniref:copper chaperone PCu(A)C n=1 Tax=Streptomyces fagopyri TaxID=2662397 RepID=UPI00380F8910